MSTTTKAVLVFFYVLIGLPISLLGAFRHVALEKVDGERVRDEISDVRQAIIGPSGDLVLCVYGEYDGRNQEYWLTVPASAIAGNREFLETESNFRYHGYPPTIDLPQAEVQTAPCEIRPESEFQPLPVEDFEYHSPGSYNYARALSQFIEESESPDAVFEIRTTEPFSDTLRGVGYASRTTTWNNRHVLMIRTQSYRKPGHRGWLVLVPFGWALDVVAWPYVLLLWIGYAGSH